MGRFTQQRLADAGDEHGNWCVDDWEAIAAEIAAQLGWSRQRASSQMNQGVTLLERLPRLAEVFAAGEVDPWIITVSVYRTGLLVDPDALAAVDALLAEQAPYWNARSRERVAELIDWIVVQHDPDAVRQATQAEVDRHIGFAPDINGMTDIYGSVRATAAAALDARLNAMAATACRHDPRTTTQRRTAARWRFRDRR
nr:DUF222 domain-containing protein [Mycobacterium sp. PS03-16]